MDDEKIIEQQVSEDEVVVLSDPTPPKKKSGLKSLIYFIAILLILVLAAAVSMNLIQKKWEGEVDKSDPNASSEVSVEDGGHYAPEYNAREQIKFEQKTQEGVSEYTPDELYALAREFSVEIYSFKSHQVVTASKSASGIILTPDGYIITNAHVVEDCTNFIVALGDGREFEAALVGTDKKTDLAVVKIDAENLKYVDLGICDEMNIGETVAALGNAGGFAGTFTTGIVSGKNRLIGNSKDIYSIEHIQFDASVNAGNSGGALVNMKGQLIGVVDSKYVANNSEGLGFAISIDEAVPVIEELISEGTIKSRVKIGFVYSVVSEQRAAITGQTAGLHVTSIDENKPVASSDLKVDDVITEVDGKSVLDQNSLRSLIKAKRAGDSIALTVSRNNETLTITTTVAEYNEE